MNEIYYGLTFFDVIFLTACLISGAHVLMRGFLREILSLFSWIGAFLISLRYSYPAAGYVQENFLLNAGFDFPYWFIICLSAVLLALASFFVLGMISRLLVRSMKLADPGIVDRALGFCFGVLRVLVLITPLYGIYGLLVPAEQHPIWLNEARTLPVLESTFEMMRYLIGDSTPSGQGV